MNDSLDNISIRLAEPPILPLVKRFFQQQGMRAQAAKNDIVYIARDESLKNRPIIGALRLCIIAENCLLRSMSIAETYQRRGIGSFFLNSIKQQLIQQTCYCFPYAHLYDFYKQAGFEKLTTHEAPNEILKLYRQYQQKNESLLLMQIKPTEAAADVTKH